MLGYGHTVWEAGDVSSLLSRIPPSPPPSPAHPSSPHSTPPPNSTVHPHVNANIMFTHAPAIALGAWLRHPNQQGLLQGKDILELGCGCALPGIAAAKPRPDDAGPHSVVLSDMGDAGGDGQGAQPWELLANARYNVAVNSAGGASAGGGGGGVIVPRVERIDWTEAVRCAHPALPTQERAVSNADA